VSADEFTNGCRLRERGSGFFEPILKDFERDSGITVKSVFDTEESEHRRDESPDCRKDNPQADVYWANEPVRAEALGNAVFPRPVSASAEGIADQFKDRIITGPVSLRARVCS
jgi:iron(III) transport system substrate-binding protein